VALRDGLVQTIAWTRENLGRIDRCIARHAARASAVQATAA
jgi:hypothetical protein